MAFIKWTQTDRQSGRQTDRQIDGDRERERERGGGGGGGGEEEEEEQQQQQETETDNRQKCKERFVCFVCWLLIVPATCQCISGTDLHKQFYVLPH